jgi:hypothetical protein
MRQAAVYGASTLSCTSLRGRITSIGMYNVCSDILIHYFSDANGLYETIMVVLETARRTFFRIDVPVLSKTNMHAKNTNGLGQDTFQTGLAQEGGGFLPILDLESFVSLRQNKT